MSFQVFRMVEKLRQVSLWATNEALLSRQLGRLVAQWEGALIRLQRHPSRSDLHLLSNTDELCASLDDSLLLLATLRASKYASSIEADLASWTGTLIDATLHTAFDVLYVQYRKSRVSLVCAGKLSSLKRLLEEYSAVQRKWNELEPIFAAADMQRQLQAESKLFQLVDKSLIDLQHDRWRGFMAQ